MVVTPTITLTELGEVVTPTITLTELGEVVTPTITLTELGEVDLITEQVLANPRALISLVPTGMEPMTEDFSEPQLLKSKNQLQQECIPVGCVPPTH